MTQHNFIGPYCHGCGLFTAHAGKPGVEDCETVIAIALAEKEAVLAKVAAFCQAHPDGIYWVKHEGQLTVARLQAASAPRVWSPLDGDESDRYYGLHIDAVEVIDGPIPPPKGLVYS